MTIEDSTCNIVKYQPSCIVILCTIIIVNYSIIYVFNYIVLTIKSMNIGI